MRSIYKLIKLNLFKHKWKRYNTTKLNRKFKRKGIIKNTIINRSKLFQNLYDYYTSNIIIVQTQIRGFLCRQKYKKEYLNKLYNCNNLKIHNTTTLLLDNVDNIPDKYVYILKDNKKYYKFDIRELYKLIQKNILLNPYTNIPFNNKIIDHIKHIYLNIDDIEELNNDIPNNSLYSTIICSFFDILSEYTYPNYSMFTNYTNDDIIILIQRIYSHSYFKNSITSVEYEKILYEYSSLDIKLFIIKFIRQLIRTINYDNSIIAKHIRILSLTNILEEYYDESINNILNEQESVNHILLDEYESEYDNEYELDNINNDLSSDYI